jgi:light-regulated signal transduction histidine kinase (bacteriophytochrome)
LLGTPEVANLLQQQPGDAHLRLRQFVEGHELLQTDLPLQRAAREAQPQLDLDLRVERAGHEDVILSGGAVPLFDEQGRVRGAVAAYHDVTARRRVEHDLQCAVEELRRSNADLEQFAYVASHDLQEPLRALSGMVQLLRERYRSQLDSRGMQYIDLAVESASRMQGLISALLTFSRVDRLYTPGKVIDTGAVLRNALANLQVAIEESGATVEQGALPPVVADAVQLTQVFQNLIGNAIKFRGLSPPQIEVGVTQLADAWRFHVRDNGIGIEPQYFERIFLIFQRLHVRHEYPGMGIGLALCKKIIERHGGKIWVESEPGVGATFFFTLPLYEKELAA